MHAMPLFFRIPACMSGVCVCLCMPAIDHWLSLFDSRLLCQFSSIPLFSSAQLSSLPVCQSIYQHNNRFALHQQQKVNRRRKNKIKRDFSRAILSRWQCMYKCACAHMSIRIKKTHHNNSIGNKCCARKMNIYISQIICEGRRQRRRRRRRSKQRQRRWRRPTTN